MHKLLCVIGRTGAGKDTLARSIADQYNLQIVTSYTTRPRRQNETNTHIFIDPEDITRYQDDIVAQTTINGYTYFCTMEQLKQADIYIIDPAGLKYLQQQNLNLDLIVVYIEAPYNVRRDRAIKNRGDIKTVFQNRDRAENKQFTEFETNESYDYIIINSDLNEAMDQFKRILKEEHFI